MKKSYIIIGVIVLFVIILFSNIVGSYNSIVTMDEGVTAQWKQVENQYQRRADLIPNLVEVVKGYAAHEKETLEGVVEARAKDNQTYLPHYGPADGGTQLIIF